MADREKIKIFELDIDIDAAIKSTANMKTEADKLRETYNELRKSTDASNEEIVRAKGAYDAANREYRTAQREVERLTQLEGKQIKTVQQARNALSVVSSQWAKQAELYGANSEEADKLAKKKLELTERLKTLEKSTGDTSRNVGNYTESMKDAIQQSGIFQRAQSAVNDVTKAAGPIITFVSAGLHDATEGYKQATASTQGFTAAQKAMRIATAASTAALKVLRVALISTGIGAIVVVLGSLVAMLTSTQEGIDTVNRVLAQMRAAFDVVTQRAARLGEALTALFSGNIREGLQGIRNAFEGMGDQIAYETMQAGRLATALQEVEKEEINLDIRRAAANDRLKELNKTIEDVTKSEEERMEAAREYQRLEEELTNQEVANQERRVAALLGFSEMTDEVRDQVRRIVDEGISLDELGLGESTNEDARELRDELGKLFSLQTRMNERLTTNQNKLNTIRRQTEAAEKKAHEEWLKRQQERIDAALKESNLRLQIFIEENKGRAKTLEESLQYEEELRDRRLAILEEELEAGKVNQTEYELEILKIKNEFGARQIEITKENAQRELEVRKKAAEDAKEAELLEQERKAVDLENRMIIEEENFLKAMEIERERLAMMREMELAEAEKTGADRALIEQKYAKINEQIEYELQRAKRDHAQHTFGEIAELLGEQTVAGKAAAVAQATINTYQGVTEVWRSPSVLPEPFATIQKLVSTGTVLASGLGAVANIKSTNANVPKAAKGATLSGPSHAQGGITLYDQTGSPVVEAEGGENIHVLNKRASSLLNSLSFINQATGGVPLNKATSYAAAGGMVRRTSSQNPANIRIPEIDIDTLALKIADANRNLPAPRVAVEEINTGQGQLTRVVSGAII